MEGSAQCAKDVNFEGWGRSRLARFPLAGPARFRVRGRRLVAHPAIPSWGVAGGYFWVGAWVPPAPAQENQQCFGSFLPARASALNPCPLVGAGVWARGSWCELGRASTGEPQVPRPQYLGSDTHGPTGGQHRISLADRVPRSRADLGRRPSGKDAPTTHQPHGACGPGERGLGGWRRREGGAPPPLRGELPEGDGCRR